MKKIININLSGRVIPIEDSAYEKLQGYIESLRRHFVNEEGRDEIINDIESRIAELMNEKVRKGATCVTDADVDEIIGSMGRPEDFEAEEMAAEPGTQSKQNQQTADTSYTGRAGRSRLYRDTGDKFIGGVCSGLANYLNLDPTIVRILFAIVTFGGFGMGILLYIILWIVLPPKDMEGFSGKRLYRNPDDRIIGGVAGGLAAYFNRKSSTIRLIFAAPLLLNVLFSVLNGILFAFHRHFFPNIVIGSFTATFTFAYVVLWIVLPEARSQYEKMEMRGEKVDVNTIRQNVKEGMQQTKERIKEWGTEVKESAQNLGNKAKEFANTRGKAFAAEAGETARRTGRGLGHAIGVLFKVFFLFVAGSIAFGLFVGLIMLIFGGIAWWPVNNFLWTSNQQQAYAWVTLIFFLGVPLIGFIIWLIRRILRVRPGSGYLGWTFGGLWAIGWIAAILFAASIGKDLREYRYVDSDVSITQPQNGKMILTVLQPELEFNGSNWWINWDSNGWDISDDTLKLSTIRVDVRKSEDNNYAVRIRRYSAGRTANDAMDRAKKIQYSVSFKDSVLDLGNGYAIDRDSKFRGQKIEIEISIPAGKKIRFDESLEEKLKPMNIRIGRLRNQWKRPVNIDIDDNAFFPWRTGIDYIMGTDGSLKDMNGNSATDDYRYKQNDSTNLDKSIEQKKQELKELEDKKNKQEEQKKQKTTGYLRENRDGKEREEIAASLSPILSLVNTFN